MRRLNEVMDLKFSLLIFKKFHGAITHYNILCYARWQHTHISYTVIYSNIRRYMDYKRIIKPEKRN